VRAIFALPVVNKESKSLRQLLHGLTSNIKALEAINRPVQHWDDLLVHLITTKYDNQTTVAWETNLTDHPPDTDALTKFLTQRRQMLESLEINVAHRNASANQTNKSIKNPISRHFSTSHVGANKRVNSSNQCVMCKQQHHQCKEFLALSVSQRVSEIKKTSIMFKPRPAV
jgi:hypothetical protein